VDCPGELGVGFELELLLVEVVIGFRLLEVALTVLPDHYEGREEDRLKEDYQRQGGPWACFDEDHPQGERRHLEIDEVH
jgi:hypothetical protein